MPDEPTKADIDRHKRFVDVYLSRLVLCCTTMIFMGEVHTLQQFISTNPACTIYTFEPNPSRFIDIMTVRSLQPAPNLHLYNFYPIIRFRPPRIEILYITTFDDSEYNAMLTLSTVIAKFRPIIIFQSTDPEARTYMYLSEIGYNVKRFPLNIYISFYSG